MGGYESDGLLGRACWAMTSPTVISHHESVPRSPVIVKTKIVVKTGKIIIRCVCIKKKSSKPRNGHV